MKKILLLIIPLFFIGINNVNAKTLSIEEVDNEYKNSKIFELINDEENNYTTKIDTVNKKYQVLKNGSAIMSLDYTDEYLEYDNDVTLTVDNLDEFATNDFLLTYILNSLFVLSGHDNIVYLDESVYNNDLYTQYGINSEIENYEFVGDSYEYSGETIKYLKLSLDTDKINLLVTTYGKTYDDLIKTLVPELDYSKVDEDSVTLIPKVENTFNDDKVYCYIYRSTSKDGKYKKISDEEYNCSGNKKVIDDELKSDTTYYYKAVVVGGDNYSKVLKVTTEKEEEEIITNDTDKKEELKNPDTGIFIPSMIIIILTAISLIVLIITKKKRLFIKL